MPDVTMPQLGETVTEGTITKWFKAVGDTVARDEPLFEVSTDKVDSEVPSPADGILTAILVEEGDTVDVGVTLAVIDGSASATSAGVAPSEEQVEVAAPAAPAPPPPAPAASTRTDSPVPSLKSLPDEPVASPPAAPRPTVAPAAPSEGVDHSLVLSPVVRKLLAEHGIDASLVRGSGLGGRITRADVEAVIERGASPLVVPSIAPTAASPLAAPAGAVPPGAPATTPIPRAPVGPRRSGGPRDEVIAFTNIRRRTAEHMLRSKATSAHTLMVREIDYERVEQVRRTHGDRFRAEEGFSLTYLPFVTLAVVEALVDFPHLNASVGEDALIVHHDINVGIAVDLDNEGLIVPVVHQAEELNLRGMARRIRDVADRARTKSLSLDDISDGTFSITNAGPFGTFITGAIINQPQVAILSTDGVTRKPVVVELPDGTESIGIHSVGLVAMNFDHRAVDGAYVARFLARLAAILDDRDWTSEL